MLILVKCIKETYTWEGDGKQHKFSKVKLGHVYAFTETCGTYWIDAFASPDRKDFENEDGFIQCVKRGLDKKYFNEMFERLK